MKYYSEESYYESQETAKNVVVEEEYGCRFCWDKRKQRNKELFFLDAANNMRVCNFCPNCGREYTD